MIRTFDTQLSLKSFIEVSLVINLSGGIVYGIVLFGFAILNQPSIIDFLSIVLTPLLSAINGAIMALFGYPIYKRWCFKIRGQKLSGIFVDSENDD